MIMDFYNKHFYRLIHHVDTSGMLNMLITVYTNETFLEKYFKTNKDFQKLDVPCMCDQLILLLNNFDKVFTIASDIEFLKNDFQRKKYPFVLFTQAFISLILIQKNSVKAYFSFCRLSTIALYKNKVDLRKVRKKKKRKEPAPNNQSHNEEVIPKLQIVTSINQDKIQPGLETNHNELDVLLNHPRHTENASEINQPEIIVPNQTVSNNPMPLDQNTIYNLDNEENIHIINRRSYSEKLRSQDEKIQTQLIEKPTVTPYLQEQPNEVVMERDNGLTNIQLKRKKSNKAIQKSFKKRPIEQSSKFLKNRMKKLEGELPDRPLECIAMKYIHHTMNHLPLRHAMYHNKLNISFAALTLNMELEENKSQNEDFNYEINMSSYQERFNHSNISNSCIYQQCINNSLPHLSLVPLAEEYLINNSLEWRNTINEINKKLEGSLKEISFQSDLSKWQEFKEKMKQRVSQCLVPHQTLIGPELLHIDVSQPLMEFPSAQQIDELLNNKTVNEHQNSKSPFSHVQLNNNHENSIINQFEQNESQNIQNVKSIGNQLNQILNEHQNSKSQFNHSLLNINHENNVMNQLELNSSQNIQKNVKSVKVYHKQSIDILQIISNTLQQFPKKKLCLMFTDLCPIHITNRRYAILVLLELLKMHLKGIVKLHQPLNTADPSSISIDLSVEYFF